MPIDKTQDPDSPQAVSADFWQSLTHHHARPEREKKARNANKLAADKLSPADKVAVEITNRVGSFGFFIIIFIWTVLWCSYNILASDVPFLHWHAFDPFPAFVAYLLISNVLQILLMPLIMVGQNLQGRHSEIRAELDYETNVKAEREVEVLLRHIEHNSELLIHLMRHLDCKLTIDEKKALQNNHDVIVKLTASTSAMPTRDDAA